MFVRQLDDAESGSLITVTSFSPVDTQENWRDYLRKDPDCHGIKNCVELALFQPPLPR